MTLAQLGDQRPIPVQKVVTPVVDPARARIQEHALDPEAVYEGRDLVNKMAAELRLAGVEEYLIVLSGAIIVPVRMVDRRDVAVRRASEGGLLPGRVAADISPVRSEHRHEMHTESPCSLGQSCEALLPTEVVARAVARVLPVITALPAGQVGEDVRAVDVRCDLGQDLGHPVERVEHVAGPVLPVERQHEVDVPCPRGDVLAKLPIDQSERRFEPFNVPAQIGLDFVHFRG